MYNKLRSFALNERNKSNASPAKSETGMKSKLLNDSQKLVLTMPQARAHQDLQNLKCNCNETWPSEEKSFE